ncbi:hypothetical protein LAZ67_19000086 [Cordylochernes scorpioides]|uniref:Uncharacterized protein n=1 Tax=Cordylochernes scorpioides TaxID=51811 RepID=A0ABY6LGT3_9ARAC|nr:hypothetical protein LAZ67_19000086 [Cordylochernes scorpioides]
MIIMVGSSCCQLLLLKNNVLSVTRLLNGLSLEIGAKRLLNKLKHPEKTDEKNLLKTRSSPDVNPLDYYMWGVFERDSNSHSHNTALRADIVDLRANIPKTHLITAYSRQRIEAVIAVNGGFIE